MARNFNGTTDRITVTPSGIWTKRLELDNSTESVAWSYAMPFELDNGDLIITCTTDAFNDDFSIHLYRSTDGGATWGSRVEVASATGQIMRESSVVQTSATNLVCAYADDWNVRCKRSTDRGATWGSQITINTGSPTADSQPTLVILSNGNILCHYLSEAGGSSIKQRISTDGGATWGSETTLFTGYVEPSLCVMDNSVVCVFLNQNDNHNYYLSRTTDNGANWSSPVKIRDAAINTDENEPNFFRYNGNSLAMLFSSNHLDGGKRFTNVMISHDEGRSWVYEMGVYSANDCRRTNGIQLSDGSFLVCTTSLSGGDSFAHIDVLTAPPSWPTPNMENLTRGTVGGWVRYAGTPNASTSMWFWSKNDLSWVPLYFTDDGSNRIRAYFKRVTTDLSYTSAVTVTDNTWFFIANAYEWGAGTGQKCKFYAGATPDTISLISIDGTPTEGAGDWDLNDANAPKLGGRIADDRTWKDLLANAFCIGRILTLDEIKGMAAQSRPVMEGLISFPMMGISPEPCTSAPMIGTLTGTTLGATRPPCY